MPTSNLTFLKSKFNFSSVRNGRHDVLQNLSRRLALAVLLGATASATAGVSVDLRLYYFGDGYFAFPRLSRNDSTPNPTNTAYFAWGPTSTMTSGIHYELYPNTSGGGSSVYDWANFKQALQGGWTLMVTNETGTNIYTFMVDVTALSSNDLPLVTVTQPAPGASINQTSPLFSWIGPAGWQGRLEVSVRDANFNNFQGASLTTSATNWTAPNPLPQGLVTFSARYTTNFVSGVDIATPLHNDTSQPFPGWISAASVETYGESEFTVSSGGGNGHTLVAHYAFDDSGYLGRDSSSQGNDINAGGTWGADHEYSTDALIGAGAVEFFGSSYLAPPEPVMATIAGDFSLSLWLKTSQAIDEPDSGIGIVWARVSEPTNDIAPLELVENKAVFFTGSLNGSEDSLPSTTDINTGNYVHVVVTRSQTSGEKRIYIDGQLDASGIGATGVLDAARQLFDLQIGAGWSGYEGLLDDVQFYTGVLSASEVQFLYDHPGETVPDTFGSALADAVDAPQFSWTTGGAMDWFHQITETHDGDDAAQSGPIGDGQESWIETSVTGPGTLRFWWKSSCEEAYDLGEEIAGDYLELRINGSSGWQEGRYLSGETDWEEFTLPLPAGVQTLRWIYHKDDFYSEGGDAAWLDQVSFTNHFEPSITSFPQNTNVFTGSNVVLNVGVIGAPAPVIRWYKNGTLLSGQTSTTLVLNNVQPGDGGNYELEASNYLGVAYSPGIQVKVYDPTDLQPLSLTAPALVGSQTLVPVSWVVTNTGPGYASNVLDYVYLATNGTSVGFVGQLARNFVAPPASTYALSNLFRFPSVGAGNYTLVLTVDYFGGMFELNEANNVATLPVSVSNPDIQPGNLLAPAVAIGGLAIQVTYNVTNNGPSYLDGAGWNDQIVLSLDNQWSADDLNLLQPGYGPTIAAGGFITRTNTVTLPVVSSGNYYLVVRLDRFGSAEHGILWETNENNNVIAVPIQITVPDLVPAQLLVPPQVSPRQPLEITWQIQNVGDGMAQAFNQFLGPEWLDTLYLSTNGLVHPGAIKLGTFSGSSYFGQDALWHTPLPAGQFATNHQAFDIPNVAEGNYFLVLSVDSANYVREIVETNNLLAVPVSVASPDLMPVALDAPPLADANSSISVSWAVTNRGSGDAIPAWNDHLYLSTNNTFEPSDLSLGQFPQVTGVPSNASYLATNNVFLPGLAPGNYFLIFRADAGTNLYESTTTNNYLARAINIASPDLTVASFDAPTNLASQQPITVTYSVANVGTTTAQPVWYDRAFLSQDAVFDGDDVPVKAAVGNTAIFPWTSPLPVGNSYTQQLDLRIPSVPAGDYFLLFQTDGTNTFSEVNEGNNFFALAVEVSNPDLLPTNLIAPTSVTITQLSQRIEVGWNVVNQDTGTVYVGWSDYVYLSTNNFLDGAATLIGSDGRSPTLNFGESYLAFANPPLPDGIQGQFYLLIKADGGEQVYESAETNNVLVSPLQVVIPPVPDLVVQSMTAPIEALSGQEIEIRWVLTNRGTATAFGPISERVYLATAANGTGASDFGTFQFTGSIAPGESVERVQRITLPISLSGQRWVVVTTDLNNQVFEFDHEDNNTLVASQALNIVLSPTPNLQVLGVNAPADVFSGQHLLVTWAVTNSGTGPTRAPFWYDAVYLSADTNFGGDIFLGYTPNAAYLWPGEAYANAAMVTIPRSANGTHYIFVKSDAVNSVFENQDENDNVAMSGPVFINLTPPPDLRVGSVNPPLTAFSGTAVKVTYGITNYGLGQTLETSWNDRVYLSQDTILDGGDKLLGTFPHVGGLEPGAGYLATNSVALPVSVTGNYFFIVQADSLSQVYEVPFEANNDSPAAFATSISLTPPADLVSSIVVALTNAVASHALTVGYAVTNFGVTPTSDWRWTDALYLSTDDIFDPATDLKIGRRPYSDGSLVPEGTSPELRSGYFRYISGLIPDGLSGTFYVFVRCDDEDNVFELDKTNNVALAANPVTVISQPADLVVRSLSAPPQAEAGAAMLVSWAVTNLSEGDSAVTLWYDRLVLSADDFLGDSDDVQLLTYPHRELLAGTNEYQVSSLVTIPLNTAPGEYRLFLITDRGNDVYEGTNEDNNATSPLPIVITREAADLQIVRTEYPTNATAGSPITVRWVVSNTGVRPPSFPYWYDSVYLSPDTVLSPSDLLLGHRLSLTPPPPGGSYTNSLTAIVPRTLTGDYYLLFVADSFNYVLEASEGNNVLASATPVSIGPAALPDLAVTAVNPPGVAYSGQPFELSWTVQNLGTTTASNNWYDAVYLSLDHFLDPFVDTYIGFGARARILAPGESYTNTASFEVPPGFAGPYFVIVATDTGDKIYEGGSELNNVAHSPQAMQVLLTPPVDLVAGPITVPANASPGLDATLGFTIYNYGSNVARGSWEDALYISADTNYDAADALFGRVRHTGDVLPGSNYSASLTAPLPGVLPGNYHVIVRSDILNHVPEDNDTNNAGASLDLVDIDSEVLTLGTPDSGTIAQGQSLYYKFNADAGDTVRVRFTTGIPLAGNEIYVSRGAMPSRAAADFAVNEPFIADPDLFIPIAETGTHYLLVYCGSMPVASPYSILAEVLPFTVATSQPGIVGDMGESTFKVRGALLSTETKFELFSGTNTLSASSLMVEDSTTAYVTFNLVGQPQGEWSMRAYLSETSTVSSTLSNAVLVVSGQGPLPEVAIDGPLQVWSAFTQPVLLLYGNSGDSDVPAPLLIAEGVDGTLVGPERNQLQSAPFQLLGRSLDGPADRLRPQSAYSHQLMYRGGGLHVQARVVNADDLRPISEADWTEIESSVRPAISDPVAWQAFWANIQPRIGATWGDYVEFLHTIAAAFPAEQRDVRMMIGSLFTNQPDYRASSFISGVVLGSTNLLPQANVEVAFYKLDTNGAVALNREAVTDGNGQFLAPFLQPGNYVCAMESTPFRSFDMNLDGVADLASPVFTVTAGSDLVNQTIYLHQPAIPTSITNDTSATLAMDAHGNLHLFWLRDESLWHAWSDGGTWVDARSFTSNFVGGFTVGSSANMVDGNSPGIIVVWSEANTNGVQLHYIVGQTNGTGYRWSDPVLLTDDLAENSSPAVVVHDDGLALITYLKRSLEGQDDTDVYFSAVNVASGDLLWNKAAAGVADGEPVLLSKGGDNYKQNIGWTKAWTVQIFSKDDYITIAVDVGGEFNRLDCEANAKLKGAVTGTHNSKNFKNWFKASGDITLNWRVHPDECEWDYLENASTGNFQIEVGTAQKNVVLRTLGGIATASGNLPLAEFVKRVTEFKTGFEQWAGIKMEDTLEVRMQGNLKGLHWKTPPTGGFGTPGFKSAELTGAGAIRFTVKGRNENDFTLLDDEGKKIGYHLLKDTVDGAQDRATIQGGLEMSIKGEVYPDVKAKTLTITPNLTFILPGTLLFPGGLKFTPQWPETVIDLEHRPQARDEFLLNGTLTYDPAAAVGTTNVYGINSVIPAVGSDLYDDGAPALALDPAGVAYQIWYRNGDPYHTTQPGTELYMADFSGSNWSAPGVIPGSLGFNGRINAATDRLGRRMAIWTHADTTGLTTNSTAVEVFNARAATDVYYSVNEGISWSMPMPVTITTDPDGALQVSKLDNGDLLAVWTSTDTNSIVSVRVSTWDGTAWSAPQVVTTGQIQDPTAQRFGSETYVLWTQVIDTNDNRAIFQSVNSGGSWSSPEIFLPKPAFRPPPPEPVPASYTYVAPKAADLFFGPPPDKCCKCKGKTTTVTNNPAPPKPCGISYKGYDYEKCREVYEFKSCPRVSQDPNDIVGPDGFGPERWVPTGAPLNYTIRFENDPLVANAPAKEVLITLPLEEDLDPRTFRLGSFGFGDLTIPVPDNQAFYQTTLDFTEDRGFILNFIAGVDVARREAFWRLTTIDPATGFLPLNPLLGFLPPDVTSPEGEGFVNFSIRSRGGALNGARLDAQATIVFDTQPPIDTPSIFNTLDADGPTSKVTPLSASTLDPNFTVRWTAADGFGGSGLAGVDIYVSEDGGAYFPWLLDTTLTEAPFLGEYGVAYSFYSIARDNAGNAEATPLSPDTTILVASSNTPPQIGVVTNSTIPALIPFTLAISVTDTDVPPQGLSFQLPGAPPGMTINTNTGLIAWTPNAAQGGTTNPVMVQVTDDGLPPLSSTASFTITVLPANTPPVLGIPTNLFTHVLQTARTRIRATDAETNAITYALGPNAPIAATLDPLKGDFRWTPPLDAAGLVHLVTVLASDNGTPSMSATQQFTITVPHYTWLTLGETNLFTGLTGSIPVQVISSAPWQEMNFQLSFPPGSLDEFEFGNLVSTFTTASVLPLATDLIALTLTNASSHELQGTQQLASLVFKAVSPVSASVLLSPQNLQTTFADGSPFLTLLAAPGRVVVLAEEPVLDAVLLGPDRHLLRLYGQPGANYQIETATNLKPPVTWLPFTELVLSNLVQTVEGANNDAPFRMYRAVRTSP